MPVLCSAITFVNLVSLTFNRIFSACFTSCEFYREKQFHCVASFVFPCAICFEDFSTFFFFYLGVLDLLPQSSSLLHLPATAIPCAMQALRRMPDCNKTCSASDLAHDTACMRSFASCMTNRRGTRLKDKQFC